MKSAFGRATADIKEGNKESGLALFVSHERHYEIKVVLLFNVYTCV